MRNEHARKRNATQISLHEEEQLYKSPKKTQSKKAKVEKFLTKLSVYLFELEDASYLFAFRLLWGIIMLDEIWNLITQDYQKLTTRYFLNPYYFNFKYYPFYWVKLMNYNYMIIFVWIMFIAAICISIGFLYRFASFFFFFGISYLFLLESTNYLNHMYLVCVMSAIMIFIPCNRIYSVDCLIWPNLKRETIPKFVFLIINLFFEI